MRINLLPKEKVETLIAHPVERGVVAQLTQQSPSALSLREKRIYGCRHCEPPINMEASTEGNGAPAAALSEEDHVSRPPTPAESSNDVQEKTRGSQPKAGQGEPSRLYSFDGLRSHAKEK